MMATTLVVSVRARVRCGGGDPPAAFFFLLKDQTGRKREAAAIELVSAERDCPVKLKQARSAGLILEGAFLFLPCM
jgi:hypothetical protein